MLERPDLSQAEPAVVAYIEALEKEVERLRPAPRRAAREIDAPEETEPSEPPTTLNVVTITAGGRVKRTPRHLYGRQGRGGMGVFDIEAPEDDAPSILTIADESQALLLFTSAARVLRLALSQIDESPVRARGQALTDLVRLRADERVTAVLPEAKDTYVALVTPRGWVRCYSGAMVRENLAPGTALYDVADFGPPAAACWTGTDGELLIAARSGRAVRLGVRKVPARGCLGIRLDPEDRVVAVASVQPDSGVFVVSADGKGTIRLMSGFAPVAGPGTGGKTIIKTEALAGAVVAGEADDLFVITRLNKIIRFRAAEVPPKEGVVQGVNCIALRGDEAVAVTASSQGAA